MSHNIGLPPLVVAGSEDLRQRIVPQVLAGEKISALAITEPTGGSDVAHLRTTARREGTQFILNGTKTYITSGMRAEYFTVAVRTGGPGAAGISLVIADRDAPGFTRSPLKNMGWWMSDTATLHFDNCPIPAANLIGEEHRGFALIMQNFNDERLLMADEACAFAAVCFDEALSWARDRHTFGEPLVNRQVIRHKLVDMQMRIVSTRAWLDRVMGQIDAGQSRVQLVAELCMLKNLATQTMQWCADQAIQILGGSGYMRGTKSERIYREVKVMMIGGGAEEIMKDLAARQLGF